MEETNDGERIVSVGTSIAISAISAVTFAIIQRVFRKLLLKNKVYPTLDRSAKLRVEGNIVALIHAIWTTSTSAYAMYVLANSTAAQELANVEIFNRQMIAITCGYFINDLIVSLHDIFESPSNIFHHLISFCAISAAFITKSTIMEYCSHITVVEISTIFLTLMVIGRDLQWGKGTQNLHSYAFAGSFFLSRIVYLPAILYYIHVQKDLNSLGPAGKYGLIGLSAIQFYWFYLIVRKLIRKRVPATRQ